MTDRTRARELAADYIGKGDPTGWFEQLYREAAEGDGVVPWSDLRANVNLLNFWAADPIDPQGKQALVVGCGLGDDAEQIAAWGFHTKAFDISETAVRGAKQRFPQSRVTYVVANLLKPPASWSHAFDFIVEIYTLQVLRGELRRQAIANLAESLAADGQLLVIARGREASDPEGEMPWPLTREDLAHFVSAGLTQVSFEDFPDPESPDIRRFRALYTRP